MASVRKTLRNVFVWNYGRGTLQYDIICALILAFIFFTPRSCFVPQKNDGINPSMRDARVTAHPPSKGNEQKKQ